MFPEKLTFDGFQYRTTRINEALNLMLLINSKIQGKKKDKSVKFRLVPSSDPAGTKLEPLNGGFEAFGKCYCGLISKF